MAGLLRKSLVSVFAFILSAGSALADDILMPFVFAGNQSGDVTSVAAAVKSKLKGAGFEVVGDYSPYDGAEIIVVTSEAQKAHAAKSDFGGYGAIDRIAITQNGDNVEVSYTNPVYMAAAYRMATDMADIRA